MAATPVVYVCYEHRNFKYIEILFVAKTKSLAEKWQALPATDDDCEREIEAVFMRTNLPAQPVKDKKKNKKDKKNKKRNKRGKK